MCVCICCRATVKMGLSFSAARPSDLALWDIQVEPGSGATPNTVSVVCNRKVSVTAKRSVHRRQSTSAQCKRSDSIFWDFNNPPLLPYGIVISCHGKISWVLRSSLHRAAVNWKRLIFFLQRKSNHLWLCSLVLVHKTVSSQVCKI